MKRPELSIAAQGWLLIVGVLALGALLIIPSLITYRGASADEAFTVSRIEDYRARIEALPEQVASKETSRDALEYGQSLQQAFSNAVRRNGGRLTELANSGAIETPVLSSRWDINFDGDLIDVIQVIKKLHELRRVLLSRISVRGNSESITVNLTLVVIPFEVDDSSVIGKFDTDLSAKNPFDIQRRPYMRNGSVELEAVENLPRPQLIGLRRRGEKWLAIIRMQQSGLPITIREGDQLLDGYVQEISYIGVQIIISGEKIIVLENPFK